MSLRSGSYSFHLTQEGTLNLKWNNSTVYWSQELNNSSSNLSSPSFVLERNGVASIYDSSGLVVVVSVRSNDYGEGEGVFRFLKLEEDGNLRIFSVSKGSEIQTQTWVAVADQCQVFGFCGDFGICRYDGFVPTCDCPSENFVPIDVNDMRKGCRRKVELDDCRGKEGMLELNNTRFLTYLPELSTQRFTLGTEACRANCLADSLCFASVLMADGSGVCFQKLSGLVSGYTSPSVPSTSSLKVCKPVLPYSTVKKHDERSLIQALIIALAVIATAFCLVAIVGALWCCCSRNSFKFGALSSHHTLLEYASSAPVRFSYKELQRCTKGFKEKLGAGGFGAVYKGMLVNRTVVAVKRLEGIEQGEKQFRTEVATIGSTHHLNLVRLIGFCSQGRHRLLVYEFMKNGSLDSFLFAADSGRLLNWQYRFSIAIGTAKAILYLHEECSNCIVHCDIKPENILLDENFNAKVSDFGLAKLMPSDKRYWNMSFVRGTRGYLAPEWIANLPITSNSDVYSYGMVLLEIVSGRRNFEVSDETNHRKFSEWAYEEFEKGNIEVILDKCLQTDETVDMEQVKRMVQVSFWCIQKHPSRRPSMGKVVQMLEGIIEIAKPLAPNALADIQDTENS